MKSLILLKKTYKESDDGSHDGSNCQKKCDENDAKNKKDN